MPPKTRKKKIIEEKIPELETKNVTPNVIESKLSKEFGFGKETNSEKNIARIIYVDPSERITSNIITQPEVARLLAIRAELYTKNQIAFVPLTTETNEKQIAIKELKMRKFPLYLIRQISVDNNGNVIAEKWDPNLMTLPSLPILESD